MRRGVDKKEISHADWAKTRRNAVGSGGEFRAGTNSEKEAQAGNEWFM